MSILVTKHFWYNRRKISTLKDKQEIPSTRNKWNLVWKGKKLMAAHISTIEIDNCSSERLRNVYICTMYSFIWWSFVAFKEIYFCFISTNSIQILEIHSFLDSHSSPNNFLGLLFSEYNSTSIQSDNFPQFINKSRYINTTLYSIQKWNKLRTSLFVIEFSLHLIE